MHDINRLLDCKHETKTKLKTVYILWHFHMYQEEDMLIQVNRHGDKYSVVPYISHYDSAS